MIIESPKKHYDIVVIGGGMVGSSFALMLARMCASNNFSMLIIEASAFTDAANGHNSFDSRSTALSFGSSNILRDAGLWDSLSALAAPIQSIAVSDKGRFGRTELSSADYGIDALGYVVENRDIGRVTQTALSENEVIDHLSTAKVTVLSPTASGMNISVSKNGQDYAVTASLAVLADGGRSALCEQLGITRDKKEYEQHALIANIAFENPHNNRAFERFTDTGPLAVLPLNQQEGVNRASLVWTVLAEQVSEYKALPESELLGILQERFGDRLGAITKIGELVHYPLTLVTSREQIRPGLVLLGNVAHTLHPVAGQGLNLALRDADALAQILAKAVEANSSVGAMQTLQKYVDAQALDQRKSIAATDGLTQLFSNNDLVKMWMRKFGLISLELVPTAKQTFAKHAMGLAKS